MTQRDLAGQRFGKLLAQERAGFLQYPSGRRSAWLCLCDCGRTHRVAQESLLRGTVVSCGCHKRALASRLNRSHGHTVNGTGSPTWRSWVAMITRCTNPNRNTRVRYFERGITVCPRWFKFENFLADMGERPAGMTLDRYPDNDGNYEPKNCRWATQKQQMRNASSTRRLTHDGRTASLTDWCEEFRVKRETASYRLDKLGQSFEEAFGLRTPAGGRRPRLHASEAA